MTVADPAARPRSVPEATPLAAASTAANGSGTECGFAEVLAGVMGVDRVGVEDHFFDVLGADSLVMAHFCAKVRKRGNLPPVSMRDVYRHPTIRSLAVALADAAPRVVEAPRPLATEAPAPPTAPASRLEYVACGALQLVALLAYAYLAAIGGAESYAWVSAGSDAAEIYLRLVACGVAGFGIVCALPILAKWMLIGRWKAGEIRLWSLAYFRFWLVKTLMRANPCALLFVGSPLYVLYLRALGARIGPGVVIFSRRIPVCTDLLTVGAGTVIRRDVFFQCYRAASGRIETGPVTLGRDVVVSERTVLDIHTSMGDRSQLGHASSLNSGQAVPAGERWHGTPAQRADVDYLRIAPMPCGRLRRVGFCVGLLLSALLLWLPLLEGNVFLIAAMVPTLGEAPVAATAPTAVTWPQVLLGALGISLVFFFGGILAGLLLVGTLPRLLNLFLVPDRVYPLYGFHDKVQRAITRLTTLRFYTHLFGDSSWIVHYLGWLGYHLRPVEQTGSNFGTEVAHGNPHLCHIGTGTMVADGLILLNDEVSSTSFRVSRVTIGPRSFLGNDVAYPAGGRTGENCLLATKVMVPLEGRVHEGTGLLGSPCFEIPRTVDRDARFDHLRKGEEFHRRLSAKNRYNLRTIGIFLFVRWLGMFLVVLLSLSAFALYDVAAHTVTAAILAMNVLAIPLYMVFVERCVARFRPLEPTYCSIYDRQFWLIERLWKLPAVEYLRAFDGTAYKPMMWRLLGAKVGRRVFDDGADLSERTMVTIGDECAFNQNSKVQCHSQEDATFKSDRIRIGAGCSVGVGAFVHYGVTMGDGSSLEADSFLMKGEEVPAGARWGGNPAREV